MLGLETARLLLDACYRDFAIARYETEKKLIQQRRGGRSVSCGMQILPVSNDKDPQESELCAGFNVFYQLEFREVCSRRFSAALYILGKVHSRGRALVKL
jgi:hypothetical protein